MSFATERHRREAFQLTNGEFLLLLVFRFSYVGRDCEQGMHSCGIPYRGIDGIYFGRVYGVHSQSLCLLGEHGGITQI